MSSSGLFCEMRISDMFAQFSHRTFILTNRHNFTGVIHRLPEATQHLFAPWRQPHCSKLWLAEVDSPVSSWFTVLQQTAHIKETDTSASVIFSIYHHSHFKIIILLILNWTKINLSLVFFQSYSKSKTVDYVNSFTYWIMISSFKKRKCRQSFWNSSAESR
jgi:hypothetical protein